MIQQNINIKHLRAFVAVVQYKSINKASTKVFLSQPAITQALKNIEVCLGHLLFDRKSDGMYLTTSGECFYFRVNRALKQLQKGIEDALVLGQQPDRTKAKQLLQVMTNTQLKALTALCSHPSILLASTAIGVSKSSLSRSVKDLAILLNVELFIKKSTFITATKAALALTNATLSAYAEISQASADIERLQNRDQGQIRIGCMPITNVGLLADDLTEFSKRYPQTAISVTTGQSTEQILKLRQAKLDIFIGILTQPNPHPDINQELLANADLVIAGRYNHPLANRNDLTLELLASQAWIVSQPETPTRIIFDRLFAQCVSFDANNTVESSSSILKSHLLEKSDTLTLVTSRQINSELEYKRLTIIPFKLTNARIPIGFFYRKDWAASAAQTQFIELMRATSAMIRHSTTPHA